MNIAIACSKDIYLKALTSVLANTQEYQIVWETTSADTIVDRCKTNLPELLLIDASFQEVSVKAITRQIMSDLPCAILIVTTSMDRDMTNIFDAMGEGALDVAIIPSSIENINYSEVAHLLNKIDTVSKINLANKRISTHRKNDLSNLPEIMVAIGASTGGPAALSHILSILPSDLPASVVIVQHVNSYFTENLVRWLNDQSQLPVQIAKEDSFPQVGEVFIAGRDDHLMLSKEGMFAYTPVPFDYVYRPSVNVFFESVANHWKGTIIGVLLTGMGNDGANGLLAIRNRGMHTIAQDKESCAVYGMPKAAIELGAAAQILPLNKIASSIVSLVSSYHPKTVNSEAS